MDPLLILVWGACLIVPAIRLVRRPWVVLGLRVLAATIGVGGVVLAVTVAFAVTDEEQDSPDSMYIGLSLFGLALALALLFSAWRGSPALRDRS